MNMCGQERKGGICCLAYSYWMERLDGAHKRVWPKNVAQKCDTTKQPSSCSRFLLIVATHGSFDWPRFTHVLLACHVVAVPHRRTNLIIRPEFLP